MFGYGFQVYPFMKEKNIEILFLLEIIWPFSSHLSHKKLGLRASIWDGQSMGTWKGTRYGDDVQIYGATEGGKRRNTLHTRSPGATAATTATTATATATLSATTDQRKGKVKEIAIDTRWNVFLVQLTVDIHDLCVLSRFFPVASPEAWLKLTKSYLFLSNTLCLCLYIAFDKLENLEKTHILCD